MTQSARDKAREIAGYGRHGDQTLVHMNGQEVAALNGIAAAFGRNLTRNPHTGMTEAFNLFDILPIALSFTGIGAPAAIALSAASGAASAAVEGNDPLQGALLGGISGALGAGLKGPADVAVDAATKGVAAAPAVTGELAADMTGSLLSGADKAAMISNMPTSQIIPGAADVMSSGFDYAKAAAAPAGGPTPGFLTDIFGAGTDASTQNFLSNAMKTENLPYLMMGATALEPLLTPSYSGPAPEEYGYIPEQFPGAPRTVNPNYNPGMSAFGEQNAFSSGVNYLGGYAEGGEVKRKFNPLGLIGGVVPMMVDGFSDGKDGSGILGMLDLLAPGLVNGRKPYGRDRAPQNQMSQPSVVPAPMSGFRNGGMVSRIGLPGKAGSPGEVPAYEPRQRTIQPTDMSRLFAGGSPLLRNVPYTQIPLPGGRMGAPVPDQSFAIATPPQGGEQTYNMPNVPPPAPSQPAQGGKRGGKQGSPFQQIMRSPESIYGGKDMSDQPQINPGPTGYAYGGMVRGYADGGMVDPAMQMDDRTVVKEAMAALAGQSPNPDAAIAIFIDRFGEEALQALMQKMQGGDGRYMQGPGDGLSDSIPATVDGQQPSALSSGEFVIPADAVSHLGNGSNEAGAKELYSMIDRLRQARTGSPTPPPAIDQRGVMPV